MLFLTSGGSELQDSAFGYFVTACVVILLAITSYFMLPKMVKLTNSDNNAAFLVLLVNLVMVVFSSPGVLPVLHGE